ncbi:MAG: FmdB family zinc ribbon protein [Actinomycetota bacterium]
MPTYEYACMSCGRHVEVVQSFSDEPLRTCEHCGGPLKKVFHPVGIVLKGSGFYSTDNRSSRSKLAASSDSKKESGSESKSSESTSSESKSSESKSSESKGSEKKSDGSTKSGSSKKTDGGSKG